MSRGNQKVQIFSNNINTGKFSVYIVSHIGTHIGTIVNNTTLHIS